MSESDIVHAMSCARCREIMVIGTGGDVHAEILKIKQAHNIYHSFKPEKGKPTIVDYHPAINKNELIAHTENSLFSIQGFTIVETLAGLTL